MRSLLDLPEDLIHPEWRTCPVPGRPWWYQVLRGDILYARRDGEVVRRPEVWCKADPSYAADADKRAPLPHPGFRPGQIWAVAFDHGVSSWLLDTISARVLQESAPDSPWGSRWAFLEHQARMNQNYMRSYVVIKLSEPSWSALLCDPIRPDLAPWSGP